MLAASLSIASAPKAQANPAVLAPVALCSTGVGCILVGTMAVGAITYYVWEYGGGKRVVADAAGRIFRTTDDRNEHWVFSGGRKQCEIMRRKNGFGRLIQFIPGKKPGEGFCVFAGKQTNFGN